MNIMFLASHQTGIWRRSWSWSWRPVRVFGHTSCLGRRFILLKVLRKLQMQLQTVSKGDGLEGVGGEGVTLCIYLYINKAHTHIYKLPFDKSQSQSSSSCSSAAWQNAKHIEKCNREREGEVATLAAACATTHTVSHWRNLFERKSIRAATSSSDCVCSGTA